MQQHNYMSIQFTDDNFEAEVIEKSKTVPVLVDFFAAWCGPCQMQGPIVDEVAEALKDKAAVGKLDTEASQATAAKYGVMSIPTILLFKNGELKETMVGLQPKESLVETINKYL